jgi:uncharacterized phiE125 gp8 family phage protein
MSHDTYTVTSDPALEPITRKELKTRLRITACDFDDELDDMITAARKQVEYDTHRRLITQTVALYKDGFPAGDTIEIRTAPVSAVTSVQYVDQDTATQTFASSKYVTDLDGVPPRIILLENEYWPTTESNYPKSVIVTVTAGYGSARTDVPVEAKLAIVEWCRMNFAQCENKDAVGMRYRNLINSLAWSGHWKAA